MYDVGYDDELNGQFAGPIDVGAVTAQHQLSSCFNRRFDFRLLETIDGNSKTFGPQLFDCVCDLSPRLTGNTAEIDDIST